MSILHSINVCTNYALTLADYGDRVNGTATTGDSKMSVDINPLGVKMHLDELEREVTRIHQYERTASEKGSSETEPFGSKLLGKVASLLLAFRKAAWS